MKLTKAEAEALSDALDMQLQSMSQAKDATIDDPTINEPALLLDVMADIDEQIVLITSVRRKVLDEWRRANVRDAARTLRALFTNVRRNAGKRQAGPTPGRGE